jgi:hypothetical protein
MKRPTLTFFQANDLCRRLVPIGDAIWKYAEQLRADGYCAFDARNDFVESFGGPDEVELHRLCAVEEAKLRLGQPWPMKFSPDERRLRYSSVFLDELYRRRDVENGCTVSELDAKYPGVEAVWRREVDPCRRNALRLEIYDRPKYLLRWNTCIERERHMIETEAHVQSPVRADQSAFEMEDRFATFREVMERASASPGFCYDKQKSRDEFPVFSKHLIEGWDLSWTLQEIDMFALTPIEGCFSPKLDLRGANLRGDSDNARTREFLVFRYQHIVPGFGAAYWKFRNLSELERGINAHMYLYRLMSPILESSVTNMSFGA